MSRKFGLSLKWTIEWCIIAANILLSKIYFAWICLACGSVGSCGKLKCFAKYWAAQSCFLAPTKSMVIMATAYPMGQGSCCRSSQGKRTQVPFTWGKPQTAQNLEFCQYGLENFHVRLCCPMRKIGSTGESTSPTPFLSRLVLPPCFVLPPTLECFPYPKKLHCNLPSSASAMSSWL